MSEHPNHQKKLLLTTLLNFSITVVQIIGGVWSNSLSLLSDAFHNMGDTTALFIAYWAGKISRRKPDYRKTFGYKRVEILAALFNGTVLIAICLFLLYEAYKRFITPEPVMSSVMLTVAVFGLLANLVSIILLHDHKKENLNIKAAYLHLLGDTLSSIAVVAGGVLMWFYEIYWIDPLISALISVYIIYHTYSIVKETIDILMQASPDNINIAEIKQTIEKINEVNNVHHIHVWRLNDSQIHFEAHIEVENNIRLNEMMDIKSQVENILKNQFEISHTTLQFGYNCCTKTGETGIKE